MKREKAFEVLAGRVMATLPDSLAQRQQLLTALDAWLPRNHPLAPLVREMQIHLEELQKLENHWPVGADAAK